MREESFCNNGRCKRVRMGEERHSKHLTDKTSKKPDNDEFFRNRKKVQGSFYLLIVCSGIISYVPNSPFFSEIFKENPLMSFLQIVYASLSVLMVGLAFAILNRGTNIKTEDRIRRIENKLDKILEHRDNVLQTKF